MTQEALKLALEELADRFSEGWHEGIKIDASDIMLLNEAAQALAQPEQETVGYWKEHAQGMERDYDSLLADYEKLTQPEQEPVAWMNEEMDYIFFDTERPEPFAFDFWKPLYTTPPQRPWVGLTEQQRNDIENDFEVVVSKHVFDAIEAKLRSKNGY